jgi:hypothetical protein
LRLRDYASKRIVGYTNWKRNRKEAMTSDSLDRLVTDMHAQNPDHIAVTGDLTNIAMREEFENARLWLEALGPPERVTAIRATTIPMFRGRIIVTASSGRRGWSVTTPSMSASVVPFHAAQRPGRPDRCLVRGGLGPIHGDGTGRRAADRASGRAPAESARRGLFRVILIHHPPKLIDPNSQWRKLTDGKRFRKAVEQYGAD